MGNHDTEELELQKLERNVSAYNSLCEISAALDFKDETALVAVPEDEVIEGKLVTKLYVIMSDRRKIPLNDDDLLIQGLYTKKSPYPMERWSKESRDAYLRSEYETDLPLTFELCRDLYAHYIDFGDSRWCSYMACWTLGTYFHRLFRSYPYIHLSGTMQSGKTKTMELTATLAFNGELTCNSTAAYIIRVVNDNHATCCIDETENLKGTKDENTKAVIAIFNSGYKKSGTSGKAEQLGNSKKWVTKRYSSYSPKMFASIAGLEDSLTSRCVPIAMMRSTDDEIKNREMDEEAPEFQELRDALYLCLMGCWQEVRAKYADIQDAQIVGRDWELWKPVLAIAQAIDLTGELYETLHELAVENTVQKKETALENFITPKLLAALENLTKNSDGQMFVTFEDLTACLVEFSPDDFGWLRSPQSAIAANRWIGKELRNAGVVDGKSHLKKFEGKAVKGYYLSHERIAKRITAYQ